ncbi:MAG: hypothetical protein K0Q67_1302 [Cellvibrio sp.]|nr:hypothetical protein [Cellvibrio sp.]
MQTQRSFWLKTLSAGALVLGLVYLFLQPSTDTSPSDSEPVITTQQPAPARKDNEIKMTAAAPITTTPSNQASSDGQGITPELQERLSAMQQRRPNQHFSAEQVIAAVKRTQTWTPAEEIPRELPLKPEEFNDGRQFIELDSLKIETLMPGDQVKVRVDKNAKDYEVIIDRIEKHDYNSISWYGHIQGDDGQTYNVSFTRGEQLTVGGLDTPDGHYVLQGHGDKGWIASSQLLFKTDTSVSDAIHPADVDPNYTKDQDAHHNH